MRKKFFTAEEINVKNEWVLDSRNSDLTAMTMLRVKLEKGEIRKFVMNSSEALIVNVSGDLEFVFDDENVSADRFDVLYLTKGGMCKVVALAASEILVCEAAAENGYRNVFVRRMDIEPVFGGEGCHLRQVWNMVSPGVVDAERLIMGYCESVVDGGWTGWPPHEHSGNLEEIYYYYDIEGPIPKVLQIVSDDMKMQVEAHMAKNGDVLAISEGFHPIVALPGVKMKNLWFMAAVKPEDRDFGVVRVNPAF